MLKGEFVWSSPQQCNAFLKLTAVWRGLSNYNKFWESYLGCILSSN